MMKKRYISPTTGIFEMFELESSILRESFMVGKTMVDPTRNMNEDASYTDETFLIEY